MNACDERTCSYTALLCLIYAECLCGHEISMQGHAHLCRATDMINGALGNHNVEFMELDVGSFAKIRSFVEKFRAKNQPLNILVNNAGIHVPGGDAPEQSGQRTPEGFEVAPNLSHPRDTPSTCLHSGSYRHWPPTSAHAERLTQYCCIQHCQWDHA